MSDQPIATIGGTMLTPGISLNRRLYTPAMIELAVGRMKTRMADPAGLPIVMRTHHDAEDDSRQIVGRLTTVDLDESGAATYSAMLYDTQAGRDIASLVTPKSPALKSVSIHGYFLGPVRTEQVDGESVHTADDLEIDAVDFTATPGVVGAQVSAATWNGMFGTTETVAGRTPIRESISAQVTEYTGKQKNDMVGSGAAMKNPSGAGSYPIKTKADLRKAIRAVGRGGADHDTIRRHIISRAKALGLTAMIPDSWGSDGSVGKESTVRLGELREYYPVGPDSSSAAGFCLDAYNGPLALTMRASGLDPAELRVITMAAIGAACDALEAMDPDLDGDIDVPGAPMADTDGDAGESTADTVPAAITECGYALGGTPVNEIAMATVRHRRPDEPDAPAKPDEPAPTTEAPPADAAGTTESTKEVPAVSEATPVAAETAAAPSTNPTLTEADLTALGGAISTALGESLAPLIAALTPVAPAPAVETAPAPVVAAPVTESTPKVTTEAATAALGETLRAELLAEVKAAVAAERAELATQRETLRAELLREYGTPARRGYRAHESAGASAEEEQQTAWDKRAEIALGTFGMTPVPIPGTGSAPAVTTPAA